MDDAVVTTHVMPGRGQHRPGIGTSMLSIQDRVNTFSNIEAETYEYGIPITYNLAITPAGLLSLAYSYNNGVFQPVISNQSILSSNGALPALVRFGFAGSTGGSNNIHEIMCFQATPQTSASSSAGLNQKQTAKVQAGTQVYFAFYNPNNWTGSLTSQYLDTPNGGGANDLQIDPVVNWDASCVLTGLAAGATCTTTGAANVAAQGSASRSILSWSGTAGIPFQWSSLTSAEQAALDTGDSSILPFSAQQWCLTSWPSVAYIWTLLPCISCG